MYVRAYTTLYPQEVAGLVLVDAATPLQEDQGSPKFVAFKKQSYAREISQMRAADVLGLSRWRGRCSSVQRGYSEPIGRLLAEHQCNPPWGSIEQELAAFPKDGQETLHTGPYGGLPILIFSQDSNRPSPGLPPDIDAEHSRVWNDEQENLKRLSTRSRRIIAKGSGHSIHIQRPDLINAEVQRFIAEIQGDLVVDYGPTTTE
jgi:pimeloyl-ACP methyl ester carboxylesterase